MEEKSPNYLGIVLSVIVACAIAVVLFIVVPEAKVRWEQQEERMNRLSDEMHDYRECTEILASFVTHIGASYDEIVSLSVEYTEDQYLLEGSYVSGVKWDTKAGVTYIMLEDESFWIENPETGEIQRLL